MPAAVNINRLQVLMNLLPNNGNGQMTPAEFRTAITNYLSQSGNQHNEDVFIGNILSAASESAEEIAALSGNNGTIDASDLQALASLSQNNENVEQSDFEELPAPPTENPSPLGMVNIAIRTAIEGIRGVFED